MLIKLLKQDIKAMSKLLLLVNGFLIVLSALIAIVNKSFGVDGDVMGVVSVFSLISYVLVLAGSAFTTFLVPVIYFYKNLFTDQGYLTFTLPVSRWKVLLSKVIATFIYYLINLFFILTSFLVLSLGDSKKASWSSMVKDIEKEIGMSILSLGLIILVIVLAQIYYSITMTFFSVTLGQLFKGNKILGSILAFIGISVIMQIVSSLSLLIGVSHLETIANRSPMYLLSSSIIVSLVFGSLFYLLSGLILKKKINLG